MRGRGRPPIQLPWASPPREATPCSPAQRPCTGKGQRSVHTAHGEGGWGGWGGGAGGTLAGCPTSLSFLTTAGAASTEVTTPEALTRHPACPAPAFCTATTPAPRPLHIRRHPRRRAQPTRRPPSHGKDALAQNAHSCTSPLALIMFSKSFVCSKAAVLSPCTAANGVNSWGPDRGWPATPRKISTVSISAALAWEPLAGHQRGAEGIHLSSQESETCNGAAPKRRAAGTDEGRHRCWAVPGRPR